jgi:hypothetical protein
VAGAAERCLITEGRRQKKAEECLAMAGDRSGEEIDGKMQFYLNSD